MIIFFLKQLIGWNGSLRPIIEKSMEMLNYPPNGLPFIIQGARGVGKKTIFKGYYYKVFVLFLLFQKNDSI